MSARMSASAERGTRSFFRDRYDPMLGDYSDFSVNALVCLHHETALRALTSVCGDGMIGRVVDIGCAVGDFTHKLKVCFPKTWVVGIDFLYDGLERGRQRYHELSLIQAELPVIPLADNCASLVVCMEILYYLDDEAKEKAVNEIVRVLAKDGLLLMTTNLGKEGRYFSEKGLLDLFEDRFVLISSRLEYCRVYRAFNVLCKKVRRYLQCVVRPPRLAKWLTLSLTLLRQNMFIARIGVLVGWFLLRNRAVTNGAYLFRVRSE